MSWRQVDCKTNLYSLLLARYCSALTKGGHINNLYNTTFWALVQKGGMDATAAEEKLKVCTVTMFLLGSAHEVLGRVP